MHLKYIKTMDFLFEDIEILDANSIDELCQKIKEDEIIEIMNDEEKEYIHSSYIMYFG